MASGMLSLKIESLPGNSEVSDPARVGAAVEETMQRGSATIAGVPGDQTDALRKEIRSAFRANGAHCGTRVFNGAVVVWLEDDLSPERQLEVAAVTRDAVARISVDGPTMQSHDRSTIGRRGADHSRATG